MARELAAKDYDRKRVTYLSVILHRHKTQQLHGKQPRDLPEFPPFDSTFTKRTTLPLPFPDLEAGCRCRKTAVLQ